MKEEPKKALNRSLINKIILTGWILLSISAALLYISKNSLNSDEIGSEVRLVLWLMGARLFGIGGFVVGLIAIFNDRWTAGSLLLLVSLGLPLLSLLLHGSI